MYLSFKIKLVDKVKWSSKEVQIYFRVITFRTSCRFQQLFRIVLRNSVFSQKWLNILLLFCVDFMLSYNLFLIIFYDLTRKQFVFDTSNRIVKVSGKSFSWSDISFIQVQSQIFPGASFSYPGLTQFRVVMCLKSGRKYSLICLPPIFLKPIINGKTIPKMAYWKNNSSENSFKYIWSMLFCLAQYFYHLF